MNSIEKLDELLLKGRITREEYAEHKAAMQALAYILKANTIAHILEEIK